jgi:hypothetical protein
MVGPAVAILALVLAMGITGARHAVACSCIEVPGDPTGPPSEVVGDEPDSVVVLGTVESVALEGDWPKGYDGTVAPTVAVLKVDRYWGSTHIKAEIKIHTENVGAACGVPWQVGDCWLIEAWRLEGSGRWQSSTCNLTTKPSTKPDVINRLFATDGPGRVP